MKKLPYIFLWMITCLVSIYVGRLIEGKSHTYTFSLDQPTDITQVVSKEDVWKNRPVLPAPKDAPPKLIKVGPFFYGVNYTSEKALSAHSAYAETFNDYKEIYLNPNRTKATLRADLIHELMHCAAYLGTGGGRFVGRYDTEENMIEATSDGMLQIMQDNPALVSWLQRTKQ